MATFYGIVMNLIRATVYLKFEFGPEIIETNSKQHFEGIERSRCLEYQVERIKFAITTERRRRKYIHRERKRKRERNQKKKKMMKKQKTLCRQKVPFEFEI